MALSDKDRQKRAREKRKDEKVTLYDFMHSVDLILNAKADPANKDERNMTPLEKTEALKALVKNWKRMDDFESDEGSYESD